MLCPLAHEAGAIEERLGRDCRVITTGQGPERVRRALKEANLPAGAWVVLVGVAGGLSMGSGAHAAERVIDREGHGFIPTLRAHSGVTVLGVDEPVFEPEAKRRLARETDAALVDCESHSFACCAQELSLEWGVVRAISDGSDDALPPEAVAWIDDAGKTRLGRVLFDLLRRPTLLPTLLRLSTKSDSALREAAEIVRELRLHRATDGRAQ